MNYIKTVVWIFTLSVLYATRFFVVQPEFLFVFALLYCVIRDSFKEKTLVLLLSGLISNALGGKHFVFCILSFVYLGFLIDWIFSKRLSKYKYICPVFVFLLSIIFELGENNQIFISSAINGFTAFLMYPLLKRTYLKREKCIF